MVSIMAIMMMMVMVFGSKAEASEDLIGQPHYTKKEVIHTKYGSYEKEVIVKGIVKDFAPVKKGANDFLEVSCKTTSKTKLLKKKAFEVCYSTEFHAPLGVWYVLKGSKMDAKIQKRPNFREDHSLKKENRVPVKLFSHTGYDRGHMANDASFDWNKTVLQETYLMSNIVPQTSNINRHLWRHAETVARNLAKKHHEVFVMNFNKFKLHDEKGRSFVYVIQKGEKYEAIPYEELKAIMYLDPYGLIHTMVFTIENPILNNRYVKKKILDGSSN